MLGEHLFPITGRHSIVYAIVLGMHNHIPSKSLTHLLTIRVVLLLAAWVAFAAAQFQLEVPLAYPKISLVLGMLTFSALVLGIRYYQCSNNSVRALELSSHLIIEVLCIAGLLFYTGGAGNPLVSYFVIPVAIAAASLPKHHAWTITAIATCLYTLLLNWHHPLPLLSPHGHHGANNWHLFGMWATFVATAILLTFFISRMAETIKLRDKIITQKREQDLRDEQLLGIAMIAAQTAHELATPLNSLKLIGDELQQELIDSPQEGDIRLLQQQINACQHALEQLKHNSQQQTLGERRLSAAEFFQNLMDHWQLLRPQATTEYHLSDEIKNRIIKLPSTINQAILNLLNNAADAGDNQVSLNMTLKEHRFIIEISNRGIAPSQDMLDRIQQPFTSTKPQGLGLGLYLTHATIERCGGNIKLFHHNGITKTEIRFSKGLLEQ